MTRVLLDGYPIIRIWDFAVTPDVLGLVFVLFAALVAVVLVGMGVRRLMRRGG